MRAKWKESKLYLGWVKLCNDMKPMTFKQKVEHIWMYYKEYMLVAFVVLMLIVAVITSAITASKDVIASGIMVNIYIDQEGYNYLSTDYFERLGGDEKDEKVSLEYIYFGDLDDPLNTTDNIGQVEAVVARVEGKMLDYMILDQYAMETYILYEIYMDLGDFFTEEELAELAEADMLIYAQQDGQEEKWPVAVDISSLPFVQDNVNSEGKTYFALAGSTQRMDICRDMWEYLHQWESEE